MKFPKCLSEAQTLERAIAGENLARYGDGEFNICMGRNCISQRFDKSLAAEMRAILERAPKGCLPCLPDPYGGTPKKANWQKYENWPIVLGLQEFGSAFITRPDSAPWIDTEEYWRRVSDIWVGKDVTLVAGSARSLRAHMLQQEAASVREVWGTYRDAYDSVSLPHDKRNHPNAVKSVGAIMEAIGKPSGPVLLCLGPTATVLAARLAKIGVHAIDLGHIGMFLRHRGGYRYHLSDLISPAYREILLNHSARNSTSSDHGHRHSNEIADYAKALDAETILDYGCGNQSLLAKSLHPIRVSGFDPGVAGKEGMPKPCDLVVCTDVYEYVERDKLENVFRHMHSITGKGAYVAISTRAAKETLADGRNAHLVIQEPIWWENGLKNIGWIVDRSEVHGTEVRLWLRK